MNDLLSLAARLEAAEGPDRELDAAISMAIGSVSRGALPCKGGWVVDGKPIAAPKFTASLDAAMTLLPEGSLWAFGSMEDGPFARVLWPNADGTYTGNYLEVSAATPALALCAASLKARAAS